MRGNSRIMQSYCSKTHANSLPCEILAPDLAYPSYSAIDR